MTKHPISNVPAPFCAACSLSKFCCCTPPGKSGGIPPPEMQLREGDLQPGDCVSIDQYVSTVSGQFPHTSGKEPAKDKYHGGTLFVNRASLFIFLVNQVSLRSGKTLWPKLAFEQVSHACGQKLKSFCADNVPFNSKKIKAGLVSKGQTISLSGVGAHHQNGVTERAIQTVVQWARSMLLHQIVHWPKQAHLDLWPFALEHVVYLWNHLSKQNLPMLPMELFTGTTFDNYSHLQPSHVWGCPTYVLDPRLQDGKKIPKWDPYSCRGMFVGVSHDHSILIGQILNLRTRIISAQYHVAYNDLFTTVPNAKTGGINNPMPFNSESWLCISDSGLERMIDPIEEASSGTRFLPALDQEWLSPPAPPPPAPDPLPSVQEGVVPSLSFQFVCRGRNPAKRCSCG